MDGTPIRSAAVGLLGSADSTATGENGHFVIRGATPGAHVIWVRGVGFDPMRVAVTLSSGRTRTMTITVAQHVPTLPAVVTTAHYPPGYAEVGLDKRTLAGNGQFITLDQIEHRQALKITDLLQHVRGIHLFTYGMVDIADSRITNGQGSCVAIILDGIPQKTYTSHDLGNLVEVDEIGAIEFYNPPEVPAILDRSRDWRDSEARRRGSQGWHASFGCEWWPHDLANLCRPAIWTRSRLGLGGYAADSGVADTARPAAHTRESPAPRTIGVAAFPTAGSTCVPPTPIDTTTLNVYAILQSGLGADASDSAWINYFDGVFVAFRRTFALPTPLPLPVFGYATSAITKKDLRPEGFAVAPTLSSVVTFTLDPTGALLASSVAATSLSEEADTSILAAIQTAAANHTFPSMPASTPGPASVRFDVIVTTTTPDATQRAIVVDQIAVPEWALGRAAALAPGDQPVFPSTRTARDDPARQCRLRVRG